MNINVLNELIKNFYLDNNEARQHAEDYYFSYLNENPSLIILLLFQNIKELKINVVYSMILLKRIYINITDATFNRICTETHQVISEQLCSLFLLDIENSYLLCDMCSTIFNVYIRKNMMKNFIGFLLEIVKKMELNYSLNSLDCIIQCYNIAKDFVFISFNDILYILKAGLTNLFCPNFTASSLRLLYSFFGDYPDLIKFNKTVPIVLKKFHDEKLPSVLSDLFRFVTVKCEFFETAIDDITNYLIQILIEKNKTQIKVISAEIIIRFAQYFDLKFSLFLKDVTYAMFLASCDVQEDICETNEYPFTDDSIFFLCSIFGKKTTFPSIIIELSKEFSKSDDWKERQ